jgi:hypothetical protein
MWLYLSRSGALLRSLPTGHREIVAYGFAGRREGLNDPDLQHVKGIGPLPEGLYTIEAPHDSATTGPYTLRLVPHPNNRMFGRSSFAMHGPNKAAPAESSHGCMVFEITRRRLTWESGDHTLKVCAD